MTPLVSIITVNYNGRTYLEKCLHSIKKQTYTHVEVIVVDNNSTDDSEAYLKKHHSDVTIIQNTKNYGFAKGNNIAIPQAKGEYLFLLNNDTELFPDTIEVLLKEYKPNSIFTARQIPINEPNSTGRAGAGADIFGYPYMEKDLLKTKIFYADGAAIFIKKADFIAIGGFDEELFMFQEDIDFSWRARIYGYTITPCLNAKLYHYFGGTAEMKIDESNTYTSSYFRRYLNERNIIRNIFKNYSLLLCIVILCVLTFFHLLEIGLMTLLGKWKVVQCYFQAYWWNIKHIKNTMQMRNQIQKKRVISDFAVMSHMYWIYSKIHLVLRIGLPEFT